jgi:hypothetical protein
MVTRQYGLDEIDPSLAPPARGPRACDSKPVPAGSTPCIPRGSPLRRGGRSVPRNHWSVSDLGAEIQLLITPLSPALLAARGCGVLSAAKITGETARVQRFHTKAAFARHNGTAPRPVLSANRVRHRLSRTGNGQLNPALQTRGPYHLRSHLKRGDMCGVASGLDAAPSWSLRRSWCQPKHQERGVIAVCSFVSGALEASRTRQFVPLTQMQAGAGQA